MVLCIFCIGWVRRLGKGTLGKNVFTLFFLIASLVLIDNTVTSADSTKAGLLTWMKRLNIIEGIAQGLLYLHKHSRLRVVHRDLKASNILLDNDMNPKISDFGLAKIFSSNSIQENTNRVVGTYRHILTEVDNLLKAWMLWKEGRWFELVDASRRVLLIAPP
ncbi:hypothetical protein EJB05_56201, partial [Eragrostis curvula]